jgi:hypothetical protein
VRIYGKGRDIYELYRVDGLGEGEQRILVNEIVSVLGGTYLAIRDS